MDTAPQDQPGAERQFLLRRPGYLQAKAARLAKEVEDEETAWFRLEAWLWIALFALVVGGFRVPQRLRAAEALDGVRPYLAAVAALALFVLSFVLCERLWLRLLGARAVDRLSYFNAAMLALLPIAFVALSFREFSWLSLFLAFNAFMIVIMWPHAMSVFPLLAARLGRQRPAPGPAKTE